MEHAMKKDDWVRVASSDTIGQIVGVDAGKQSAEIVLKNGSHLTVSLDVLHRVDKIESKKIASFHTTITTPRRVNVADTIDLHGIRVKEAIEIADKFIDDALVGNLSQVRIIHGHGAGKIRNALHRFLTQHNHVKHFRPALPHEGGSAVTVVEFK